MSRPPLVTDELPDRWVFRPLARPVARLLVPTPITPNQVTVGSALCGVGGGVALAVGAPVGFVVLIGLMLLLDCVDGQLARLRGGGDVWGRIVDGLGDYATSIAVHVGLIVWLLPEAGAVGAAWTVASGLSMAWGAYLLDKYKRRYRGDVDDPEVVREVRDRAQGLKRFFVSGFLPYAMGVNHGPVIPDPDAYRERVRPAMALWRFAGPTTRLTLAAVFVALGEALLYVQVTAVLGTLYSAGVLALQRTLQSRAPAVVAREPARAEVR
jgi:hypothetical protein